MCQSVLSANSIIISVKENSLERKKSERAPHPPNSDAKKIPNDLFSSLVPKSVRAERKSREFHVQLVFWVEWDEGPSRDGMDW